MCLRCSWASAANTDSRSASLCAAREACVSDLDLLNRREFHGRAAVAHRLPDRRDLRQRMGTLRGRGILPRESLHIEDTAVSIRSAEDEVGRLIGHEAKPLLAAGMVRVNDQVETRRGRQLVPGDIVAVAQKSVRVTS